MVVLRAFQSAQAKGTIIPEVVCFEKQPQCMEAFQGRIMHAHDFRSAETFKDQRVLVIGTR